MHNVDSKHTKSKLSICGLGIAFGIVCGLAMLLRAYLSMKFNLGTPMVTMLGSLFPGYNATIGGGIIGFFFGFLKGFTAGALIAWIYNKVLCCCPCPCCKHNSCKTNENKNH